MFIPLHTHDGSLEPQQKGREKEKGRKKRYGKRKDGKGRKIGKGRGKTEGRKGDEMAKLVLGYTFPKSCRQLPRWRCCALSRAGQWQ